MVSCNVTPKLTKKSIVFPSVKDVSASRELAVPRLFQTNTSANENMQTFILDGYFKIRLRDKHEDQVRYRRRVVQHQFKGQRNQKRKGLFTLTESERLLPFRVRSMTGSYVVHGCLSVTGMGGRRSGAPEQDR